MKWFWWLGGGLGAWWLLAPKKATAQSGSIPGVSTRPIFTWTVRLDNVDRVAAMIRDHLPEVNQAVAGCLKNGRFIGWTSSPDVVRGGFSVSLSFEYDGLLTGTPDQIGRCLDKNL